MNKDIYQYFLDTQEAAEELMTETLFGKSLDQIADILVEMKQSRLFQQFQDYVVVLPVVSFNGSGYDINLNKQYGLLSLMAEDGIQFSAKKANRYMAIGS